MNPNNNGSTEEYENIDLETRRYIPVLDDDDDPFTPCELNEAAIKGINIDKSFDGVCPGLLSKLPMTWFMFLLQMFNRVFFFLVCATQYPGVP